MEGGGGKFQEQGEITRGSQEDAVKIVKCEKASGADMTLKYNCLRLDCTLAWMDTKQLHLLATS